MLEVTEHASGINDDASWFLEQEIALPNGGKVIVHVQHDERARECAVSLTVCDSLGARAASELRVPSVV